MRWLNIILGFKLLFIQDGTDFIWDLLPVFWFFLFLCDTLIILPHLGFVTPALLHLFGNKKENKWNQYMRNPA